MPCVFLGRNGCHHLTDIQEDKENMNHNKSSPKNSKWINRGGDNEIYTYVYNCNIVF